MPWTDQSPPANDIILTGRVFPKDTTERGGVSFEIDVLHGVGRDSGTKYRVTVGNLWGSDQVLIDSKLDRAMRRFSDYLSKPEFWRK